ncbi:hypothetical protein SBX64_16055 [Vibrio rhizosphaerae]|uniref:Uncharacterized protein n=1 Tax=Vibrio rhizosphaerae TaxID=398736 RepID=A0ABU4J0M2_9VIBR|nr:hypothetical protein [Vibrio rhizosphaerae]MDW6094053.1 hypothetical protein [Vibrio rhizosphaerae]
MSKVSIAYIGPKESKKDTITGSRQVFPRMTPIAVDESVAANLLRYDRVFVEASKLDDVKKLQATAEEEKAKAEAALKAQVEWEAKENNYSVVVAGEQYDLNKMAVPKIQALLVGADIELEEKGAQESAPDYKKRIRDAIRAMQADGE